MKLTSPQPACLPHKLAYTNCCNLDCCTEMMNTDLSINDESVIGHNRTEYPINGKIRAENCSLYSDIPKPRHHEAFQDFNENFVSVRDKMSPSTDPPSKKMTLLKHHIHHVNNMTRFACSCNHQQTSPHTATCYFQEENNIAALNCYSQFCCSCPNFYCKSDNEQQYFCSSNQAKTPIVRSSPEQKAHHPIYRPTPIRVSTIPIERLQGYTQHVPFYARVTENTGTKIDYQLKTKHITPPLVPPKSCNETQVTNHPSSQICYRYVDHSRDEEFIDIETVDSLHPTLDVAETDHQTSAVRQTGKYISSMHESAVRSFAGVSLKKAM